MKYHPRVGMFQMCCNVDEETKQVVYLYEYVYLVSLFNSKKDSEKVFVQKVLVLLLRFKQEFLYK